MFVWDSAKIALINVETVTFLTLSEPPYFLEGKNFRVIATTVHGGAHMLCEGTRDECMAYMEKFAEKYGE
jgi:hypothetical protein